MTNSDETGELPSRAPYAESEPKNRAVTELGPKIHPMRGFFPKGKGQRRGSFTPERKGRDPEVPQIQLLNLGNKLR